MVRSGQLANQDKKITATLSYRRPGKPGRTRTLPLSGLGLTGCPTLTNQGGGGRALVVGELRRSSLRRPVSIIFIGRWCSRLIGPSYLETSTRPPAVPLVPLAMPNPETCLRCGSSLWTQGGRLQVWPYCPVCSQVVVGVDIKESRIPGAGFGLFASRGFDPGQSRCSTSW